MGVITTLGTIDGDGEAGDREVVGDGVGVGVGVVCGPDRVSVA